MNIKEVSFARYKYTTVQLIFGIQRARGCKYPSYLDRDIYLSIYRHCRNYYYDRVSEAQALALFDCYMVTEVVILSLFADEDGGVNYSSSAQSVSFEITDRSKLLELIEYSQTDKQFNSLEEVNSFLQELRS